MGVGVRVGAGVTAVAGCLLVMGCGAPGGGSDGSSAPASPGARAACPPQPVVRPASRRPAPRKVVDVAARYLAARESWLASCRGSTTAWERQARALMTPRGWRTHPRDRVDTARVRPAMTRHHWNVRVTVSCASNPEMGRPRATWHPLFCSVTDATVDASGAAVPAAKLPHGWPFAGQQNPAPIAMVRRHGTWLVDRDLTGLAQ